MEREAKSKSKEVLNYPFSERWDPACDLKMMGEVSFPCFL